MRTPIIDSKKALKAARLVHLTNQELDALYHNALDAITLTRVKAHLSLCPVCKRRLTHLEEEYRIYHSDKPIY